MSGLQESKFLWRLHATQRTRSLQLMLFHLPTIHLYSLNNMGKRGPSRSLFASLPVDLRNTIRTNGRYLSMNGPDLDSFQIKQEMLAESSGSGSRLLRTQPESMSPEKDEGEDPTPVIQAGPSGSGSKGFPSAAVEVEVQVEAEASLAGDVDSSPPRAVKRRRTEGAWVVGAAPSLVRPVQKRRKGKELPVHNAYEGHPWDCTGLVERYVNRDHVPDDIKKCELGLPE